jgi:uncharacterized protein (DUF2147 family)
MNLGAKCLAVAAALVLSASSLCAAELSPVGRWRTVSDETGKQTGVVEISESNGALSGRIVKMVLEPGDSADPVCQKCEGPERGQRIMGMTILKGVRPDGDKWDGGTILDPRSGNIYRCQLRVSENGRMLFVRGYMGVSLLGRTQTWQHD